MSKRYFRKRDPNCKAEDTEWIEMTGREYYRFVTAPENKRRFFMTLARLCPYCGHKIEILSRGTHGYAFTKCPNCGENVGFPPVSFRLA